MYYYLLKELKIMKGKDMINKYKYLYFLSVSRY